MYETISDYLANWLDEDWDLQYLNWQDALEAYVRDDPRRREPLVRELNLLIQTKPDEGLMNELLHARRAILSPLSVANSYSAWAKEALGIVDKLEFASDFTPLDILVAGSAAQVRWGVVNDWYEVVDAYVRAKPGDVPVLLKQLKDLDEHPDRDPLLVERAIGTTDARSFKEASARIGAAIESAATLS